MEYLAICCCHLSSSWKVGLRGAFQYPLFSYFLTTDSGTLRAGKPSTMTFISINAQLPNRQIPKTIHRPRTGNIFLLQ